MRERTPTGRSNLPSEAAGEEGQEQQPLLEIQTLNLLGAEFERAGTLPPEDERLDPEMSLESYALEPGDSYPLEWSALMKVEIRQEETWKASVTYAITFRRTAEFSEGDEPEEFWESVAYQLVPTTIYPYARETLSTLLSKAGFSATPPVVDFRKHLHEEIERLGEE